MEMEVLFTLEVVMEGMITKIGGMTLPNLDIIS
jgi:hypothetical protein